MKLTNLLLLVTVLNVFGNTPFYGQNTINLDFKDVQIKEVLSAIENQSDFFFLYSSKMIDVTSKVDVRANNNDVTYVLNDLFKGTDIAYNIKDKQILLSNKESVVSTAALQQNVITGIVRDATGNPIPGVTVVVSGTTVGAATDMNGRYSLNIPSGATTLQFSFIGMESQDVAIGSQRQINVSLRESSIGLDEVVVTALGIRREAKTLGYATVSVAQDQISTVRTASPMQALQGKISGVNIMSLGTGPGSSTKIRIRGNSSFSGINTPLIVVNGVPIDNTKFSSGSGGDSADGGDGFLSINPDDIETMTVLKGAAAAALYGSRAKDGVIMITTKQKGENRGLGVSYTMNFSAATVVDDTDFQYEYGQGENGVRPTSPNTNSGVWSFGEKMGGTYMLFDGIEVPYEPIKDKYKQFYRTGINLGHTISFSNGGEHGGFDLSLSSTKNNSIVENSDFTRRNITLGFTQNISKYITVSGNINYSNEYNKNPVNTGGETNIPYSVATTANTMPWDVLKANAKDVNGNETQWSRFAPRTNPYFILSEKFDNIHRDRLFGNLTTRLNLTDKIYIQGRLGQDYYSRVRDYNRPTGLLAITAIPPQGYVNGAYYRYDDWFRETNFDLLIGAREEFGDFGVNVTLGGNQMHRQKTGSVQTATDFVDRGLYTIMNGRAKTTTHSFSERKVNSLFGAAEVSYKSFLFLNFTARNEWFSTLSPANRSILYPSATASFIFSEVMTLPDWVTFGKVRASYAEVGDDNVSPYSDVQYYSIGANLYPGSSGSYPYGQVNSATIPNPDLRPLRVKEWEAGVDFRFFGNRVAFDFAYYNKLTIDQIVTATVARSTGYTSQLINIGESVSKGFETALTVRPIDTRNFTWAVNGNVSYNTSEVLKLGLTAADTMITTGGVRAVVGQKLGQIYTYRQLTDANGNKVFQGGLPVRDDEQYSAGTNQPTWFGGITNTFDYKGVILSFLVDFKLGKDYMTLGGPNRHYWRHGLHKGTLVGREQNAVVGEGVNKDGTPNTTAAPLQPYYEQFQALNIHDYWKAKAGYWKLRQISLGYDFRAFMPQISPYIKGVRLSLTANNVLLLKKWVQNLDPDNLNYYEDTGNGGDMPSLPPTRNLGFTLNVKF